MKQIYIVLTRTGTILSGIIRGFTRDEYTHVSIALDKKLNKMYSFGRLNPYNPFIGGFIREYINKGTFKRFVNTKALILELEIEDEQYKKIKEIIKYFEKNKEKFTFNVKGMFLSAIDVKVRKRKSFYCAQFVKHLLDRAGIKNEIQGTVRPENFKELENTKIIYEGLLRKYNHKKIKFYIGERKKVIKAII